MQEYVLISTDEVMVECYRRGEERLWLYSPYYAGETITLESVGVDVPVEMIYRNVQIEEVG